MAKSSRRWTARRISTRSRRRGLSGGMCRIITSGKMVRQPSTLLNSWATSMAKGRARFVKDVVGDSIRDGVVSLKGASSWPKFLRSRDPRDAIQHAVVLKDIYNTYFYILRKSWSHYTHMQKTCQLWGGLRFLIFRPIV